MANIDQLELPNGTTYDIDAKTVNNHTVAKDVPSDAAFTDKNVEQIVSTGESSAFLRILTSPSQTDSSETIISSVAASDFATISAQRKTIQLDGGQLLARDSRDSTKYLIFSGDDIYNHKTWDGNNTDLTDALADKANTADLATVATSGSYNDLTDQPSVYTQTEVDNLLADKQDSLLGGNISSGADLDDYRIVGNYWNNNLSGVSNTPTIERGMLEVIRKDTVTNSAMAQRYTASDGNAITGVYERVYASGAWQGWKQIDAINAISYIGALTGTQANPIDLNNYSLSGTGVTNRIYWIKIDQYCSNAPMSPTNYGSLEILGNLQRFTHWTANGSSRVWVRYYINSVWNPWVEITNKTINGATLDSSANNQATSTVSRQYCICDSTNNPERYIARFYGEARADGSTRLYLQAGNSDTSGNFITNSNSIIKRKDGTSDYTIANPANFRKAISIQDSPTILEPDITSSQTVSTGNYKSLGSFTLTTGTWIVSYKAEFSANASGLRRIMLTSSSGSNSPTANSRITAHAASNSVMDIGWTTMIKVTSTSATRYLTAYQNSGSDLTVTGYVKAIKVINV